MSTKLCNKNVFIFQDYVLIKNIKLIRLQLWKL